MNSIRNDEEKNFISSLTFEERSYLKYLKFKGMARRHWINQKYKTLM